jgi:hypothetical protein
VVDGSPFAMEDFSALEALLEIDLVPISRKRPWW